MKRDLVSVTEVERFAQESRQRIVDGVVDEWGKDCPEGPRKKLTEAQWRAYDSVVSHALAKMRKCTPSVEQLDLFAAANRE